MRINPWLFLLLCILVLPMLAYIVTAGPPKAPPVDDPVDVSPAALVTAIAQFKRGASFWMAEAIVQTEEGDWLYAESIAPGWRMPEWQVVPELQDAAPAQPCTELEHAALAAAAGQLIDCHRVVTLGEWCNDAPEVALGLAYDGKLWARQYTPACTTIYWLALSALAGLGGFVGLVVVLAVYLPHWSRRLQRMAVKRPLLRVFK